MLYPADALFGDREEQLAIAHNACRRIMLSVVVEAERNHSEVRFISSRCRESMYAFMPSLKIAWWCGLFLALDVTRHRKRQKSLPQIFVELQARDAMPPSIVGGRRHDTGRKKPRAAKKVLPDGSIAMKHAHDFQFGSNGLPGETAFHYQAQNVRFGLNRFQYNSRDVFRYSDFFHL